MSQQRIGRDENEIIIGKTLNKWLSELRNEEVVGEGVADTRQGWMETDGMATRTGRSRQRVARVQAMSLWILRPAKARQLQGKCDDRVGTTLARHPCLRGETRLGIYSSSTAHGASY